VVGNGSDAIEHGSSSTGRWLRAHRIRIALIVAAAEAIVVAFAQNVSKWTVFALALIGVAIYLGAGRGSRSDTFRQTSWIFAVSQLLAALAAIFAFVIFWMAIVAFVLFAAVALFFAFTDRR